MAGFQMKPMFDKGQYKRVIARFRERVDEKIILMLCRAGEFFVSHARQNHSYKNRTGNLTSSIGYIVVKNGVIVNLSDFKAVATEDRVVLVDFTVKSGKYQGKRVQYNAKIKGGTGQQGVNEGQRIATEIAGNYPDGIVLIGVAGMEYGKYVEAMGYDVITGASIATEEFIRRDIKALMNKI